MNFVSEAITMNLNDYINQVVVVDLYDGTKQEF